MNGRKERYISKELNGTERAAKLQVEVEGEKIKGTPTDCLREDPEGKRRLKSERKKRKRRAIKNSRITAQEKREMEKVKSRMTRSRADSSIPIPRHTKKPDDQRTKHTAQINQTEANKSRNRFQRKKKRKPRHNRTITPPL